MTETKRLALVAKVTDKIGSEGKDVKFTFSTSSAGSPTDVLGGYIAELPIYRYQHVTLAGLTTEYQDVSIESYAFWTSSFGVPLQLLADMEANGPHFDVLQAWWHLPSKPTNAYMQENHIVAKIHCCTVT